MEHYSTIKDFVADYRKEMKKPDNEINEDYYYNYNYATHEQFDEFMNEYDCKILRYPENGRMDCIMTFYKNNNPDRIMYCYFRDFVDKPNKLFPKDYHYMKKHNIIPKTNKTKEESLNEKRQNNEDKLRESMEKEGCTLTSKYESYKKPVHYTFEGMDYSVQPTRWNMGVRPHKAKCIRYTHEHIAQLFEKEGCKLISPYKNQMSKLKYLYNDKEYEVIWNDWKFYNCRPHLGQKKTYFTEERK